MQLQDVMTRNVEEISPDSTLKEAAQRMRSSDIGALPVCQNNQLVGIITDRDIAIRAVAEGGDPNRIFVREAMTPQPCFCYSDQDVHDAVQLMEDKQIRRLPVFDRNGRVCGIVSLGDIATRVCDERMSGEALEQISAPNIAHL